MADEPAPIQIEDTNVSVDDWINGATFTETRVEIHTNPALWAELEPLYEQIKVARDAVLHAEGQWAIQQGKKRGPQPDEVLGTPTAAPEQKAAAPAAETPLGQMTPEPQLIAEARAELAELEEAARALWARYDSRKEVWHIRAAEQHEVDAAMEEVYPTPAEPTNKKARGYKVNHDAWTKRVAIRQLMLWSDGELARQGIVVTKEEAAERARIFQAHNDLMLSRMTLYVEVNGTRRPAPAAESMEALRQRPHGADHYRRLVNAMWSITRQDVELPAPKSLRP